MALVKFNIPVFRHRLILSFLGIKFDIERRPWAAVEWNPSASHDTVLKNPPDKTSRRRKPSVYGRVHIKRSTAYQGRLFHLSASVSTVNLPNIILSGTSTQNDQDVYLKGCFAMIFS